MEARDATKGDAVDNTVSQTSKDATRSASKDSNPNTAHHVDDAVAEDTMVELNDRYVKPGFMGMFQSRYVTYCALVVRLGGFLFGYDQGVVSIILVMPQFLDRFERVDDAASGAGFWKGLMTAMIQLGALLGACNQGWIAEKYSRKYSIVIAVVILVVGTTLQTAAVDYAMLTVSRFIGGIGVGQLSMVVPMVSLL